MIEKQRGLKLCLIILGHLIISSFLLIPVHEYGHILIHQKFGVEIGEVEWFGPNAYVMAVTESMRQLTLRQVGDNVVMQNEYEELSGAMFVIYAIIHIFILLVIIVRGGTNELEAL